MKRARISLVTSMVIFGTIGLFRRFIPVSSGELALYRAILAAVMVGGVLLVTRQSIPWKAIRRQIPLLLLSGAGLEAFLEDALQTVDTVVDASAGIELLEAFPTHCARSTGQEYGLFLCHFEFLQI